MLPAYIYGTLLSSSAQLPILIVLYYLLLAPCLSPWYSSIFYCLPAYPYGTYHLLLATVYTNVTLLSSTGSLLIPMLFYYFLLDPCLYLWYSTTFHWLPDYPLGNLLSSSDPLPITMILFYLLLAHCLLYYRLLAPCISL